MNPRINERLHFPHWLNDQGLLGKGAEVGVYNGEFARHMLQNWKGVAYFMVDLWQQQDIREYPDWKFVHTPEEWEEKYLKCLELTHEFPSAVIKRGSSNDIAHSFEDKELDFVYLDANHTFEAVNYDLIAWYPKVKSGGLLGGMIMET